MRSWRESPGFRIRLTALGGIYLLFCIAAGGSAINTGNNGLYLVAAFLLGTLATSGVVSRRNLWRVAAELEPRGELWAGRPGALGVRLVRSGKGISRSIALGLAGGGEPMAFLDEIRGGEVARVAVPCLFPRRGRNRLAGIDAESRFPLGLFRKTRSLGSGHDVLVWPSIFPVDSFPLAGATRGEGPSKRRGRSAEFDRLRPMVSGDDPRDIHWKQTARQRRTIVRERLAEGAGWTTILLDLAELEDEVLERRVSAAASLAVALLAAGESVALRSRRVFIPAAAGELQRRRILDCLAVIGQEEATLPLDPGPPVSGERRIRAEEVGG